MTIFPNKMINRLISQENYRRIKHGIKIFLNYSHGAETCAKGVNESITFSSIDNCKQTDVSGNERAHTVCFIITGTACNGYSMSLLLPY